MTKFKDRGLQRLYEACRQFAADRSSSFWIGGLPHRGASHRAAYWNGRGGQRCTYVRNSQCHACWAAGHDDLKDFGPVAGWDYGHSDIKRAAKAAEVTS